MTLPNVLVLPHVGRGGGAGIYNSELMEVLSEDYSIATWHTHSDDYNYTVEFVKNKYLSKMLSQFVFPNYSGVSVRAKVYYLAVVFLLFIPCLILIFSKRKELCSYRFLVLTSSVQLPLAFLLKVVDLNLNLICLVQEDLRFESLFGQAIKVLAKQGLQIVSITKNWQEYSSKFGIHSMLLHNKFEVSSCVRQCDQPCSTDYDIIYVGGGGKLKGFNHILGLIVANEIPGVRFLLLGHYSNEDLEAIKRAGSNSEMLIDVKGQVDDIQPYLKRSRLLLLPITSPHFCRPAIEAAIFAKPFLIPNFPSVGEFAIDGYNCSTFQPGSQESFNFEVSKLLRDNELMVQLGVNNQELGREYSEGNYRNLLRGIIRKLDNGKS